MTEKPFRYTFDAQGRVMQTKPQPARRPKEPKPRRTGTTRKWCSLMSERILNHCYPGEIPAAVFERALRELVKRDGKRLPKGTP